MTETEDVQDLGSKMASQFGLNLVFYCYHHHSLLTEKTKLEVLALLILKYVKLDCVEHITKN
jgi:hypothetical protein